MTPSTVRDNLKTALQSISGLRVFDYVPDSTNIPTNNAFAIVGQLNMNYDFTLNRGFDSATCQVIVVVGRMSERNGQERAATSFRSFWLLTYLCFGYCIFFCIKLVIVFALAFAADKFGV